MHKPQYYRFSLKVVGLAALSLLVAVTACDFLADPSKGESAQTELEREFKAITPPPGATPRDYHASHKSRQALVGSGYSSDLPFEGIRKYYDEELAKNGWKFHDEYALRDRGRDFGGRTVEYCKGEYRASLVYAGERANYGWVYAIDLSWGLDTCG